ncbi:putative phosphohydrolase [uncultured Desulfobacterium sp.]|uniref:Putative phosphohydrolase n=1 Tax=uncultured Desulfobacterium sp. TaxID=201089 RepID=A0A445MV95_9BACT|nr:putative phosphohydrolase [uncultured Desulfobacterium sp.]
MRNSNSKSCIPFKIFLMYLSLMLASGCAFLESRALMKQLDSCPCYCNAYTPERVILNLTEDPSQSQAVTWRTCAEIEHPKAQIEPAADFPDLKESLRTIDAVSEKVILGNDKAVYHHSAVFKALKPDTIYVYRVGTDDNWSEWSQFRTACKSHDPFEFVYLGDPQEDIKSMCSQIFRVAYKKAPNAVFWLFVGDLVDNGDEDADWAELFYGFGWIPAMTPIITLPGNHEYPDRRYIQDKDYKLAHLWRSHFTLPENGPQGLEETVYFIDYQGVRFVMLNGNEKYEEQAIWLDRILSENPKPWAIVGIHQPVYSTAKHRDNLRLQNLLVPIFDKHSVDLVLEGHDHTYCRTYKLKNGVRVGDNNKGTVYVISVSGPKLYQAETKYKGLMAKIETGRQLFQVISIDHNRLIYSSFDVKGELYDSFVLEK